MLEDFQIHIDQNYAFLYDSKIVVAISGGIDSVVLAYLCKSLSLNFSLAHCNFNLRGEESDADENFVLDLGEVLDVEVFIQNFDTEAYAKAQKRSIQMAARELRYDWFKELAEQLHFDYILTAHHADDNLETFLINFTRGTGLNGITGIPEINDNIVRPLLQFSREQIEDYAKGNNIKWREDSSNSSRKYLRNKLRHEVVPILKEINPQLLDSFQSTINNLNDTADIIEESLNAVAKRAIVNIDDTGITYKVSEFKKVNNPKAYLFEMFKNYGFTEWNDVVDLLDAETGKHVKSNTHRLIKHGDVLILTSCHSERSEESLFIDSNTRKAQTSLGLLIFNDSEELKQHSDTKIYVDKTKLKFPLIVRHWKEGDRFSPFGMKGQKKLSKFFKDEKYSLIDKEKQLVLCSDDNIVWVIGKRLDNRFRVEDSTTDILEIELKK
ncbi:tRNA lysidine(34) synthetase TilS [Ichthyenterobacterium sp. W332]|uniref:tRNA(Ile)-lysidine synthase n=1 Tax=Microcosmobacter mediterraneus TaxID=3075607 RepID=A0ABU2YKR4_9FLAO|nr:tRNA lysidine(34) synthetase TilS [Ichthyenterobacterium sp. W332]MDT0558759.1 tRNA lysidine(34) synthetase TilS [Ichthyenterobacterium sp. W332]